MADDQTRVPADRSPQPVVAPDPDPGPPERRPRGLARLPRAVRDMGLLGPAYLVPGAASFATIPILFAVLGAPEYGRWALLYGIAAGVPQVTTSWLEARLVRFSYLDPARSDRGRATAAVVGSIVVSAPLAAVILPGAALQEIVAAAILTAAVSRYLLMLARLQSAMRFAAVSFAASTRSLLGAALGIAAGIATGQAAAAIGGLGAGYLVGELAGRVFAARRGGGEDPVHRAGAGEPVGPAGGGRGAYELASGVNAVAQYELQVGDRFILSARRSLSDVGIYTATYALVDLAGRFLPAIVLGVFRPRIFRAWDAAQPGRAHEIAIALAGSLTWVVAASVTALVAVSQVVDSLPVERALAGPIGFGFACFVAANTVGLLYSAATRQGRLAAHAVGAAALNLALNAALIPSLGPLGAAVATAVSYAALLGANLVGLRAVRIPPLAIGALASTLIALGVISLPSAIVPAPVALVIAGVSLVVGVPFVAGLARTAIRAR